MQRYKKLFISYYPYRKKTPLVIAKPPSTEAVLLSPKGLPLHPKVMLLSKEKKNF
jgi:hypothetical protein